MPGANTDQRMSPARRPPSRGLELNWSDPWLRAVVWQVSIPPMVNTFIGIFVLLTAAKVALAEPAWQGYSTEVYFVLAAIGFIFCYSMSRYSRGFEAEFGRSVRR